MSQGVVDIVVNWSREWKLVLKRSKIETSFFSLGKADQTWQQMISIDNQVVWFEPNHKFLGVTLDRTFVKHVDLISVRVSQKKILGAMSHFRWGWRKGDVFKVYLSHIRTLLNYAGGAWQPQVGRDQDQQTRKSPG